MKKVVVAFIAGALLMVSGQALADQISRVGLKVGGEASVFLNGKQLSDAIIVDNKSYAPVRDIAEAFGADVGFEGATKDSKAVIDLKTTPENEGVPNVDPDEVLTAERYEELMYSLINIKESAIRKIDFIKDAIRRADAGQFKPTEAEYADFKESLAYYEAELVTVEQEIVELEARKAELEAQ